MEFLLFDNWIRGNIKLRLDDSKEETFLSDYGFKGVIFLKTQVGMKDPIRCISVSFTTSRITESCSMKQSWGKVTMWIKLVTQTSNICGLAVVFMFVWYPAVGSDGCGQRGNIKADVTEQETKTLRIKKTKNFQFFDFFFFFCMQDRWEQPDCVQHFKQIDPHMCTKTPSKRKWSKRHWM